MRGFRQNPEAASRETNNNFKGRERNGGHERVQRSGLLLAICRRNRGSSEPQTTTRIKGLKDLFSLYRMLENTSVSLCANRKNGTPVIVDNPMNRRDSVSGI